jgi:hypothetical protein
MSKAEEVLNMCDESTSEERKKLSTPEKHQETIAIKTLKMADAMVGVMGGMTKDEAKKFLKSIGYTDDEIKKLSK